MSKVASTGYSRYINALQESRWDILPLWIRRSLFRPLNKMLPFGFPGKNYLRRMSMEKAVRYADAMSMFSYDVRQQLFSEMTREKLADNWAYQPYIHFFGTTTYGGDVISQAQNADLHVYLPEDILVKVDRMSMLNSLETRAPLLDYRLIEFMARLPTHWKVRGDETKYLLRRAMADLLPSIILGRGKRGFGVPLSYWFRGELNDYVISVLTDKRTVQRGIVG